MTGSQYTLFCKELRLVSKIRVRVCNDSMDLLEFGTLSTHTYSNPRLNPPWKPSNTKERPPHSKQRYAKPAGLSSIMLTAGCPLVSASLRTARKTHIPLREGALAKKNLIVSCFLQLFCLMAIHAHNLSPRLDHAGKHPCSASMNVGPINFSSLV